MEPEDKAKLENAFQWKIHRIDQFSESAMNALLLNDRMGAFTNEEIAESAYRVALAMESEREKVIEKLKWEAGL